MSEPSSPITPWAPSLTDTDAQKDVAYLCQMFPSISDEFLLRALEEGNCGESCKLLKVGKVHL